MCLRLANLSVVSMNTCKAVYFSSVSVKYVAWHQSRTGLSHRNGRSGIVRSRAGVAAATVVAYHRLAEARVDLKQVLSEWTVLLLVMTVLGKCVLFSGLLQRMCIICCQSVLPVDVVFHGCFPPRVSWYKVSAGPDPAASFSLVIINFVLICLTCSWTLIRLGQEVTCTWPWTAPFAHLVQRG